MKSTKIARPYLFSLLLIVGISLFGAVAAMLELPWLFVIPLVGLVAWSDTRKLLVTFEFSALFVVLMTGIVILGTFFHKSELWSSYWFMGLMGSLGLSSLLCVVLKFNKRRGIPYIIIHLSIVIVLVGSFLKFQLKETGFVHIQEGMVTNEMLKMVNGRTVDETAELPFSIRLNKFNVDFYESKPQVSIFEHDKDRPVAVLKMDGQTEVKVGTVNVKLLGFREHPYAPMPDHPPMLVKMAEMEVDGKRGFVMEGRPVRHKDLAFMYRESSGMAKVYRSDISLLDDQGNELVRKTIVVNDPLVYDGWWLYQSNWDPNNLSYSGIQAVKDPGMLVVFAGLILLALGTLLKVRFKQSGEVEGSA